ncbi:MAG TPA: uroporphyrinogen-III C-methyltransferase, partial [Tepidiformaceae bacterium]|nr:uroporphyrinogen-III C-methyltransferase [Tepidiformaceae bacterium]
METTHGHVWLVGAGPGDPGLLTLTAVRALAEADVVLYDALLSPRALEHCSPGAELVPVGKRAGQHSMSQEEINALLVKLGAAGKRVVRLKGGDPFVFGRGGEEGLALREAGVAFTVVPGVTSAVAVPALAGIPVTHRGVATNVAVVTGTGGTDSDTADWEALARIDTVVIL